MKYYPTWLEGGNILGTSAQGLNTWVRDVLQSAGYQTQPEVILYSIDTVPPGVFMSLLRTAPPLIKVTQVEHWKKNDQKRGS